MKKCSVCDSTEKVVFVSSELNEVISIVKGAVKDE